MGRPHPFAIPRLRLGRAGWVGAWTHARHGLCALALLALGLVLAEAAGTAPAAAAARPALLDPYEDMANKMIGIATLAHWPEGALGADGKPIQFCMLGTAPFGNLWRPLERTSTPQGRPLRVRAIVSTDEADRCALVFIAQSEAIYLSRHLKALSRLPVLTVSDIGGFVKAGGMVEMQVSDAGVDFRLAREIGIWKDRPSLPFNIIRLAKNYDEFRN